MDGNPEHHEGCDETRANGKNLQRVERVERRHEDLECDEEKAEACRPVWASWSADDKRLHCFTDRSNVIGICCVRSASADAVVRRSATRDALNKVILTIDDTRILSGSRGVRVADELAGPVQVGDLEHEKQVGRFVNTAPKVDESKASVSVGFFVRIEYGLPPRKVRHAIATKHVSHHHLDLF
jgi:hypothetical protein